MRKDTDILRFIDAQESPYAGYCQALDEIKRGKKITHWIWYIFPQFRAFGHSARALHHGIADKEEVERYLGNTVLNAEYMKYPRLCCHRRQISYRNLWRA